MAQDEGASPKELIFEACRRNNVDLLSETLQPFPHGTRAQLLNNSRDGIGNYPLHVAATYGSYDCLDYLLDQEGLEVDPVDRMEGDTPLHKAVRYTNSLSEKEWESGEALVEVLIDAGANPRALNKAKLKPMELVDPRNTELRTILQKAEFSQMAGTDVINPEDEEGVDGAGSASDSE